MVEQIAERIFAVGVADPERRWFHGHEMSTAQGTTYNAYLVVDDRETVLVDSVYPPAAEQFLANIREVVDPAKITIIVANHAEPDHGGSLDRIRAVAPGAKVICTKRGVESLAGWHHADWSPRVVATGDTLETGALRLTFIQAMMCHWPDSMMTYVGAADGSDGPAVLLSNDAFGQHFTRCAYDDEADPAELWFEAEKYFVNIISPYCRNVQQRLKELGELGVAVRMIAPSHGVIWRRDTAKIVEAYGRWASQRTEPRCVICFDTMYDSTRRMAEAVAEGLAAVGVPQRTFHLPTSDRSDVLTHLYGARGILVGSSVWHMNVLPSVATLLEDLKTLRFQGRLVGAFGSYGWQKLATSIIETRAREAGYDVPVDGVLAHWKPHHDDLQRCREFGGAFGRQVLGE